ncbi:uncharacterized protein METZ01_LOCUS407639, partial [marine metagenome]
MFFDGPTGRKPLAWQGQSLKPPKPLRPFSATASMPPWVATTPGVDPADRMDLPLLEALPDLLGDEPALISVLGRRSAALVVPEPVRAIVLAAVARRSGRRPLLVVVPTGSEAERLVGDLGHYLGPDEVELFPAWETLP